MFKDNYPKKKKEKKEKKISDDNEQSLATKLVVVLGYNLTQYFFTGGEF